MYRKQSNDPREITARYDSVCAETGKKIKEGDGCIYYPLTRSVYHIESKQAVEFGRYMADLSFGYNY